MIINSAQKNRCCTKIFSIKLWSFKVTYFSLRDIGSCSVYLHMHNLPRKQEKLEFFACIHLTGFLKEFLTCVHVHDKDFWQNKYQFDSSVAGWKETLLLASASL